MIHSYFTCISPYLYCILRIFYGHYRCFLLKICQFRKVGFLKRSASKCDETKGKLELMEPLEELRRVPRESKTPDEVVEEKSLITCSMPGRVTPPD